MLFRPDPTVDPDSQIELGISSNSSGTTELQPVNDQYANEYIYTGKKKEESEPRQEPLTLISNLVQFPLLIYLEITW